MPDDPTLTFLPWAAAGLTAHLTRTAGTAQRAPVVLTATVTATTAAGPTMRTASPTLRLLGPGDVTGIDAGQVLRTLPPDGAVDVEQDLFPSVELALPTLPWLFTAAQPDGDRLMPWIRLVAVPDTADVTLEKAAATLTAPLAELPDPTDAWAWAHVQYHGTLPTDAADSAAALDDPTKCIARLLCPRLLAAHTRYLVCMVPTSTVGQQAGLGGAPSADAPIVFGWPAPAADGRVQLPVYHHFAFTTGDAGDFASLAKRLVAPAAAGPPPGTPTPQLRTSWPIAPGTTSTFTQEAPSALTAGSAMQAPVPDGLAAWLRGRLTLDADPPELSPPVYGAIQSGALNPDLSAAGPRWLRELNIDPRLRVAAGLGSQVVAAAREDLVAGAFAQLGEVVTVNARFNRGQMGRDARERVIAKHVAGHPPLDTLQLLGPLSPRLPMPPEMTGGAPAAAAALAAADPDPRLPTMVGTAYRRLTRRGPQVPIGVVPKLPPSLAPDNLLGLIAPQPKQPTDRVLREYVTSTTAALAAGRPDTLRGLAPSVAFPTAMWAPLAALHPEGFLPGGTTQPTNSLQARTTDPAVIAAYLVGLNDAVTRLLTWRSVPADRTATPFRRFWSPDVDTIPPIGQWLPTWRLADAVGPAQTVLTARADLFRRYPTTGVYAVAAQPTPPRFRLDSATMLVQPVFTALLPPDTRLFVFPIDLTAPGTAAGYFVVLEEQVRETRFGDPQPRAAQPPAYRSPADLVAAGAAPPAHSATVADLTRRPPVVVAIAADALTPAPAVAS